MAVTSRLETIQADPDALPASPPNFDRIARAYRWLEYLTLGRSLERMRHHHLDAGRLDACQSALILGDGDGRFTARVMQRQPDLRVTAIDASRRMLDLLQQRCQPFAERLNTIQADARAHPAALAIDLVVTHFFLDCLSNHEVENLISRLKPTLEPGTLWLVSEFRTDDIASRSIVRSLYLAFRILTGLRVTRLPHHANILRDAGFRMIAEETSLRGLLATELWILA